MADDKVDLRFLGQQVQNLQGDVRDLRAEQLRLESDVAGLRADLARMHGATKVGFETFTERFGTLTERVDRLETEVRAGFKAVDAKIDQVNQTMTTNLQVILAAIRG